MNTISIDTLRRRAKKLHKAYESGHTSALERVKHQNPRVSGELLHADFLHVIAREEGFDSWPKLKIAVETKGLAFAQQLQRLKIALYRGQNSLVEKLLAETPDLADGHFGLQVALLNKAVVAQMLATESELATRQLGPRRALLHLAFSRYIHCRPELADDMLAILSHLEATSCALRAGSAKCAVGIRITQCIGNIYKNQILDNYLCASCADGY